MAVSTHITLDEDGLFLVQYTDSFKQTQTWTIDPPFEGEEDLLHEVLMDLHRSFLGVLMLADQDKNLQNQH